LCTKHLYHHFNVFPPVISPSYDCCEKQTTLLLFLYTDSLIQNSFFYLIRYVSSMYYYSKSKYSINKKKKNTDASVNQVSNFTNQIPCLIRQLQFVSFILNERTLFDPLRLLHFRCGPNSVLFVLPCLLVDPSTTAITTDWNCSEHVGCTHPLPPSNHSCAFTFPVPTRYSTKTFL